MKFIVAQHYVFCCIKYLFSVVLNPWSHSKLSLQMHIAGVWRSVRRKKSGTMGKIWPSEFVWYYILFQSYTITNWNHIMAANWAPDNLLKGLFPQRGDPWPQACQQSSTGWLGHGCRGYMQQHIHRNTQSFYSLDKICLNICSVFVII